MLGKGEIRKRMNKFSDIAETGASSRIRNNAKIYMRALKWVLEE